MAAAYLIAAAHAGIVTQSGPRLFTSVESPSADFAARCAEPEVVRCISFDADDDFNVGSGGTNGAWGDRQGIFPVSGTSTYHVTRDTSQKASGASSLRFTIPATAGSDTSGSWFTNFSDDLSFTVGEGDTVYIQWRQRIDASILSTAYTQSDGTTPSDGIKLVDVSAGDLAACALGSANTTLCPSSCYDFEVVVQNVNQHGLPQTYANCSGPVAYAGMSGFSSNITVQNGVGCLYPDYDSPPCVLLYGDEWMTFQIRITVGTWDQWDSTIQLWVAREGEASVLVIDCSPTASDKCNNGGDRDGWYLHNSDTDYEIGKIWLTPYHTNRSESFAYQQEYVWYDDLIISTAHIADPGESSGGGTSELSQAVNGLSAGEWGTFTVTNQPEHNPGGDCPASPWPYSPRLLYDETNQKIIHYGGAHGEASDSDCVVVSIFDIQSNAWEASEAVSGTGFLVHGYDMATMDEAGNLYFFVYGSCDLRRRNSAGSYSTLATATGCYNITRGLAYHPTIASGAPGLVLGDGLNLMVYSISGNSWTSVLASGSLIMGDYSQCAEYVPVLDTVFVGGGNGDNTVIRVNDDQSYSNIASAPTTVACSSAADNQGNPIVSTHNALRLLDFENNDYYDFDGTSWSGNLGSMDTGFYSSMDSDKINARVYIKADAQNGFEGDAIVFFKLTSQSALAPSTTAHVWRLN